jgi:hypothetical protein
MPPSKVTRTGADRRLEPVSEDAAPYILNSSGACAFCAVYRGRIAWSSPLAMLPDKAAYWLKLGR